MIQLSRWKVILVALSVVLGLLFAMPNVLPPAQRAALPGWMPKNAVILGLDLQGSSYLLLEADIAALRAERINNLTEDVRVTLREAAIPATGFQRDETGVVVTIQNPADYDAAVTALMALARPNAGGVADRTV